MEFVKRISVFFMVIFQVFPAMSAFETAGDNPYSLSLGGAGCASRMSLFALNPAVVCSTMECGICYRDLYNIPELQETHLSLHFPWKSFGLGGELFAFGDKVYSERIFSLSCAESWRERISIGAKIGYYHLSIDGCGEAGGFSLSAGGIYRPIDKLVFGLMANHINQPFIGRSGERLNRELQSGISYSPIQDSEILCDIFLTPRFKREFRLGLEYRIGAYLQVRAGVSDLTRALSAGTTITWNNLGFHYAVSEHYYLGWTHFVGVGFRI
jgi:hypothetical protein